jgi:hypothetical protein
MSCSPAGEREHHQHDEAERDARRTHIESQALCTAGGMRGPEPHDRTQEHQNGTCHDRQGSRDRQGDDKTHPPGGDGT